MGRSLKGTCIVGCKLWMERKMKAQSHEYQESRTNQALQGTAAEKITQGVN
jgi:hypothetical protein